MGIPNGLGGNGAYLTSGGVWTDVSSRSLKDRMEPLNAENVLAKIRSLPIERWYYRGTQETHIGPYAEDFHAAFGTGALDSPDAASSLAALDVAGVGLLGIQALAARQDDLQTRYEKLMEEVRLLRSLIETLATENALLRAKLQTKVSQK